MSAVPTTTRSPLAAIAFQKVGKLHYYPVPPNVPLVVGAQVVAETERGTELGEVKILRDVDGDAGDTPQPFRILRLANGEDSEHSVQRKIEAQNGLAYCQSVADRLRLDMKIVDAEVGLDGQQITLYFVADTRIDFRVLVKETAGRLQMRVHLHQVGTRDHAKALGGYGPCGRPLCCTTFLRDFAPVSMKMAKDQSLFLNPSKFSGVCGKLMCCLRYEHDVYLEAREHLPQVGMTVSGPDGGRGVISDVDIFHEIVSVVVRTEEDTRTFRWKASEVTTARACGDCGAVGGGCGGKTEGACGVSAKTEAKPIQLEVRRRDNATGE